MWVMFKSAEKSCRGYVVTNTPLCDDDQIRVIPLSLRDPEIWIYLAMQSILFVHLSVYLSIYHNPNGMKNQFKQVRP